MLTDEFAVSPDMPHFSFEFEYKSRGTAFNWNTKAQLDQSMPSLTPFREQWKVNGPTVIEFVARMSKNFVSVVVNGKKLDVNSPAEANTIQVDSAFFNFASNSISAVRWADS